MRCEPIEAFGPSFGHSHLEHRVANRRRFEAGPDRQHGLITALFEGHRRDHFTGWIALVLRTVRLHHIVPVGRVYRTVERHDESLGYHNQVSSLDNEVRLQFPFFEDLLFEVMLSRSGQELRMAVARPGESPREFLITPRRDASDSKPVIGIQPPPTPQLGRETAAWLALAGGASRFGASLSLVLRKALSHD